VLTYTVLSQSSLLWLQHYNKVHSLIHSCVGPLSLTVDKMTKLQCVDAHVLVDALAYVIGSEEKEFCTPCIVALALVLKTAVSILGSKEKVSESWHPPCILIYDNIFVAWVLMFCFCFLLVVR